MTTFEQAAANIATADKVTWLGRLTWYGVSEVRVPHQAVVVALVKCNLGGYLPRPPSDVDVFRRVCSAAQRNRVPDTSQTGKTYHNYLVRDLPMDSTHVHKVLVRETVAPGNLKYQAQVACIDFEKATGFIVVQDPMGELALDTTGQTIVAEIQANYQAERGMLNSYGIRELIRKILLNVQATNVRGNGGGLYFVSSEHADVVDNLEAFAGEIPGVVLVQSVPLIDNVKQRAMVREAYELETKEATQREIDDLTDLIAEVQAGKRKVTNDRVTHYTEVLHESRTKQKKYETVLETNLDTASSQIVILQQLVVTLSGLVV